VLGKPGNGPKSGLTGTACTDFAAPSATRRLRNHVKKIIGKPCAGKPHARIERGMGKRIRFADTAPLTTNGTARVRREHGRAIGSALSPPGRRPPASPRPGGARCAAG